MNKADFVTQYIQSHLEVGTRGFTPREEVAYAGELFDAIEELQ